MIRHKCFSNVLIWLIYSEEGYDLFFNLRDFFQDIRLNSAFLKEI